MDLWRTGRWGGRRANWALELGGGGVSERSVLHCKKSRPAIATTAREKQLSPFLKFLNWPGLGVEGCEVNKTRKARLELRV